jgi:hypothetical protein
VYIWLFVGLIQIFFDPSFLSFLNYDMRGYLDEGGRGVCSFAPEPSFYGVNCIFFFLINKASFNNKKINILLILQIVFLARSTIGVLFLGIYFIYHVIFSDFNKKKILAVLTIPVISFFILNYFLIETRIFQIYSTFMDDPSSLLIVDESANSRFAHIFFSIKGFLTDYFLPHGYNMFNPYMIENAPKHPDLFPRGVNLSESARIMSGYGAALFELGILGLPVIFVINYSIFKFYNKNTRQFLLLTLFLNTILFSAIQLSSPILGFLIGYLSFYKYKKNIPDKKFTWFSGKFQQIGALVISLLITERSRSKDRPF